MAGEIELLDIRALTHVIGHDATSKARKQPVSELLLRFTNRAAMVGALAVMASGACASDGRVSYIYDGGTSISDMPGFSPVEAREPYHHNAKGGGVDDAAALRSCINARGRIRIREQFCSSQRLMPYPGTTIEGEGWNTGIKMMGSATASAIDLRNSEGRTGDVLIRNLVLDGDASGRGVSGGNGIMGMSSGRVIIDNVLIKNWPNAGILIDGQAKDGQPGGADGWVISRSWIIDNGGVGISNNTVRNVRISDCFCRNNGLENLTKDGASDGVLVTNSTFKMHRGGCGNIGWDGANNSSINNCLIDCEDSTAPGVGNRNGICLNGKSFATQQYLINGNIIINYREYGVRCRDRTGETPAGYRAGRGMIVCNIFKGGTGALADIYVGLTDHQVIITPNQWDKSYVVMDTDPSKVILPNRFHQDVSLAAPPANDIGLRLSTDAGYSASISFRMGGFERWRLRRNGSGDMDLMSYDAGGTSIGTAMTWINGSRTTIFYGTARASTAGGADLGSVTIPWNRLYAKDMVRLDAAAGVARLISIQSGSVNRWEIRVNSGAESGSNAGSDFDMRRYSDAGALLGTAMVIFRGSGTAQFEGNVRPEQHNAKTLGEAALGWLGGYFVQHLTLNAQAGAATTLRFQDGGITRFEFRKNASNDLDVIRYDAAGASLGPAFAIINASGNLRLSASLTVATGSTSDIGALGMPFRKIYVDRANLSNLPIYADNDTASAAGLEINDIYRTYDGAIMIRY